MKTTLKVPCLNSDMANFLMETFDNKTCGKILHFDTFVDGDIFVLDDLNVKDWTYEEAKKMLNESIKETSDFFKDQIQSEIDYLSELLNAQVNY